MFKMIENSLKAIFKSLWVFSITLTASSTLILYLNVPALKDYKIDHQSAII